MKTKDIIIISILSILWFLILFLSANDYKEIQAKPQKIDSLKFEIKVRDSIIYDLYQENKRLKLQQQNFQ